MGKLHVVDHPLIQHKLTIMRMTETGGKDFRQLLNEITELMGYELTRDLPLDDIRINTPVAPMTGKAIMGKKLAIVPILRAGLGMVPGVLALVPSAKVGHIGMYRDEETRIPHEYYCKLPNPIDERIIVVTDPMLATGYSAVAAVDVLLKRGVKAKDIVFVALVAAPEGVQTFQEKHPDIKVFVASLDDHLNEDAYIIPGLGDAGDRIFGTK